MLRWLKSLRNRKDSSQALTILHAFVNELDQPLGASDFQEHVRQTLTREETRSLMEHGYRLRLIECRLFGTTRLSSPGPTETAILRLSASNQEKIVALAAYLNTHDLIGIGEPVRLYVFITLEQIQMAAQGLVDSAFKYYGITRDEMQVELLHRCVADGYVYAVAEQLVAGKHSQFKT
jgi:hypothetical protein